MGRLYVLCKTYRIGFLRCVINRTDILFEHLSSWFNLHDMLINSPQSSHNASLLQIIIRSLRGTVLDSTEQTIFKLSCVETRKPNIHDGVGKLIPT